jgi:hypothetical protein
MHRIHKSTALRGTVVSFNLSPKGVPEGILLQLADNGAIVQINFDPEVAGQITVVAADGQLLNVDATTADAHADAAHPVFDLLSLSDASGKKLFVTEGSPEPDVSVRGKVVRLNHARRGEVNGGILDSGEFVHLKPHGVKAIGGLCVGQIVEVRGEVRSGWSGHRVIEVHSANGIEIAKPHKDHGPGHQPPEHKAPGHKHGPKHGPRHKAAAL